MRFVWFSEQLFCTLTTLTHVQHCKREAVFSQEGNKFLDIRMLGFQQYQLYGLVILAHNKQTNVSVNTKNKYINFFVETFTKKRKTDHRR